MTIDPTVDVLKELLPLFGRDAVLQDSRAASPVKFRTDGDEGLGLARQMSGDGFVIGEQIVKEIIEVGAPLAGGGS